MWWHIACSGAAYPALADEFFERIVDGTGLTATDPVYLLRERIHSVAGLKATAKPSPHQQFCLLVEVFNAWVEGRTMRRLPTGGGAGRPRQSVPAHRFTVLDLAARV
ncbi:hypothetical protein [Streptomyces sp. SYP-A7185]|uniref:hypothetical protein n=1 Tax=Streptomyces sp. SYP-A7185 TaxID=3040076 RepID=UPI0038F6F693